MKASILIVEDNEKIAMNMQEYLQNHGGMELTILWADNGLDGLELALSEDYDLILLDVMMPGLDGFTVCKRIREQKDVPIVFLTAKVMEEDILTGYAMGGDDYLTKPFSLAQLAAKIQAILRRRCGGENELVRGNLTLNPAHARVTVAGETIHLPLKEYEMLRYFMINEDQLISKEQVIVNVWGYDAEIVERALDNHVKNLRKAIQDATYEIVTVRKQGYLFSKKK